MIFFMRFPFRTLLLCLPPPYLAKAVLYIFWDSSWSMAQQDFASFLVSLTSNTMCLINHFFISNSQYCFIFIHFPKAWWSYSSSLHMHLTIQLLVVIKSKKKTYQCTECIFSCTARHPWMCSFICRLQNPTPNHLYCEKQRCAVVLDMASCCTGQKSSSVHLMMPCLVSVEKKNT